MVGLSSDPKAREEAIAAAIAIADTVDTGTSRHMAEEEVEAVPEVIAAAADESVAEEQVRRRATAVLTMLIGKGQARLDLIRTIEGCHHGGNNQSHTSCDHRRVS